MSEDLDILVKTINRMDNRLQELAEKTCTQAHVHEGRIKLLEEKLDKLEERLTERVHRFVDEGRLMLEDCVKKNIEDSDKSHEELRKRILLLERE